MARAFSLWRMSPSDCSKCSAVTEIGSPVSSDLYLASSFQTAWLAGPHPPPSASHMRGINWIPASEQTVSVFRCVLLKSSYPFTATEPSSAVRSIKSLLSPLVTAKSRAAGAPLRHFGKNTSAGLRPALGSLNISSSCTDPWGGLSWRRRPGRSSSGFRPALRQRWKTSFRRRLCHLVRSPPQEQIRQWSPNLSTTSLQKGQWCSVSNKGTLSHRFIAVLKRVGSMCVPKALEGIEWSQDPAPLADVRFRWGRL